MEAATILVTPGNLTPWNITPLVLACRHLAIWPESQAARSSQSPRQLLKFLPVGAHPKNCSIVLGQLGKAPATRHHGSTFTEEEVTILVGLKIEGELMKSRCDKNIVIKTFVKVGFSISIEIVEPC